MTLLEFCRDFFPGEEIISPTEEGMAVHFCRLLELESMWQESGRFSCDQILPSHILNLLQPGKWQHRKDEARQGGDWTGEGNFLLTQETLQTLERFHLVLDPQAVDLEYERRPYFRMRGRPVTEEQAFDILCRTNMPLSYSQTGKYPWKNLVYSSGILDNDWFDIFPHGWVRPDGTVGMNGVSGIKYPEENDIMTDIIDLELAFPYLDLVIAITDWDEVPDYVWKALPENDEGLEREDYPDFLEHIICGLWLHNNTVELMAAERAREKYLEYNRLYGGQDEDMFKWRYCKERGLRPVDTAYLKRMIRAHGLDPEEVLAGYEWGLLGLQKQSYGPVSGQYCGGLHAPL